MGRIIRKRAYAGLGDRRLRRRALTGAGLVLGVSGLGGCLVKDHTNPTISVERATVSEGGAELELVVENRSAFDVTLTEVRWQVSDGVLPLGEGVWRIDGGSLPKAVSGSKPLPADQTGSTLRLSRTAPFDEPPLDPDLAVIELSGEMIFDGAFTQTPFRVSAPVGE